MTGDRNYGLSTVWVNPCQARVSSMEEAVGKLTTWASSGPNCPYALVCSYMRAPAMHHSPRRGTWASYPREGWRQLPVGQSANWKVCQLLITSPQVIYPIGLNECNEPIITSLPELLASSISLTTGKPVYLEIDVLPSPVKEPEQKVLPLGKVSTIMIASPHKSIPPKSGEGSMTTEVRNLLS